MTGDEESYREFVTARYAALRRTAYVLTGDHHDAEDLVQTALMKAAGVWGRIRQRPEPYVRRIMYHENVSRWRRRRVVEEPLGGHDEANGDGAERGLDRVVLADALARLTPKQRTVLVLRHYENLKFREIAEVLEISGATVEREWAFARAWLFEAIEGSGGTG